MQLLSLLPLLLVQNFSMRLFPSAMTFLSSEMIYLPNEMIFLSLEKNAKIFPC
jgi:hypothetical protein